ncbi:MAG TPA: ATP-binding protein, partial [Micromonosporaceae bacterium]
SFVNLGRRNQNLLVRQLDLITSLENAEVDADSLASLFQLDHLATRMRRNDENLLVLAGADSTRVQRQPAALIDVLRAAQSEVEHYTRVELGVVDRDIEIAAHAVNDLVHLIAELLDNATVFSPPDSAVVVEARRVGDRAVLYVEDHGIGMSAEQMAELNERLATPPMVDVAVSRMMGLVVVARLANRHGIKVELRPAPERGTIADVLLPTTVLTPRALAGRGSQAQGGLPARPSAPLALETGSASTGPTPVRPTAPAAGGPSGVHPPAQRGTGRLTSAGANSFASTTDSLDADRLISGSTGFIGGAGARNLPAWSDLTGAGTVNGANGSDPSAPGAPRTVQSEPLPQRRVHDHWGASENTPESDIRPVVPRQTRPAEPAAPQPPAEADTAATVPPGEAVPDQPQAPALPVPESLASALDMTTEMPKVHVEYTPDEAAGGAATGQPAATPQVPQAAPVAGGAPRYPDETMEMPIFRELESAWFRARPYSPAAGGNEPVTGDGVGADPAVRPSAATWSVPVEGATTNATSGAGAQVGETRGGAMAESSRSDDRARERGSAWQTSADAGWSAASAAADPQAGGVTGAGLPRRVPMAQLVPGGVEKAAATPNRRSPDAVRGLLSAYHRGVQRGRTQPKADQHPESRTTGSHTGKEQEA